MNGIDVIIKNLLSSPEDWIQEDCTIMHVPTRIEIWNRAGLPYPYRPERIPLSFIDGIKLLLAIRKWRRLKLVGLAASLSKSLTTTQK